MSEPKHPEPERVPWLSQEETRAHQEAEQREAEGGRQQRRALTLRRKRRQRYINRFTNNQRSKRAFLTIETIVAACVGSQSEIALYTEFVRSIQEGEFETNGKPMVLFLEVEPFTEIEVGGATTPEETRLRRSRYRLQHHLEGTSIIYGKDFSPESPLRMLLGSCWLPRDVARRWMERRGYSWPNYFDPEKLDAVRPQMAPPAQTDESPDAQVTPVAISSNATTMAPTTPQPTSPPAPTSPMEPATEKVVVRKARKSNQDADRDLAMRITQVEAAVRRRRSGGEPRRSQRQMAQLLVQSQPNKRLAGFGESAVREIIRGRYGPMKRLREKGLLPSG